MAGSIDTLLALLIPGLVLLHLLVAPYTKVEESFNIQAVHDILVYGIPHPLSPDAADYIQTHYDHATFPGSVPRTFVGAAVLSGLARPFVGLLARPEQMQLLVRGILGLLNALALVRFRTAVDVAYGRLAGRFYLLFVASQFHVLYYASRTLPNMLAFPLTTEALRAFVLSISTTTVSKSSSRRRRLAVYLLSVAAILFRSELALLMFAMAGICVLRTRLSLAHELLPALIASAIIALPLTIGLDTLLWLPRLPSTITLPWSATWTYPIWPELQGFLFNAISGHSSEWGTSPWHWYLTSALPRLLINPLIYTVLIPLSLILPTTRSTTITTLAPALIYTAIYSLLPHKELRFILYIQPLLLAPAAAGASYIFTRRSKSALYHIASSTLILSLGASFLLSSTLLSISALNYPGGHALALLHTLPPGTAHLSNLALQTGVTRFQSRPGWIYDKTDEHTRDATWWAGLDYAVVENPLLAIGAWDVTGVVEGYTGLGIKLPHHETRDGAREVLVPFNLLPTTVGWAEEALRTVVQRYARGVWPHVRLGHVLYVLEKGKTPV